MSQLIANLSTTTIITTTTPESPSALCLSQQIPATELLPNGTSDPVVLNNNDDNSELNRELHRLRCQLTALSITANTPTSGDTIISNQTGRPSEEDSKSVFYSTNISQNDVVPRPKDSRSPSPPVINSGPSPTTAPQCLGQPISQKRTVLKFVKLLHTIATQSDHLKRIARPQPIIGPDSLDKISTKNSVPVFYHLTEQQPDDLRSVHIDQRQHFLRLNIEQELQVSPSAAPHTDHHHKFAFSHIFTGLLSDRMRNVAGLVLPGPIESISGSTKSSGQALVLALDYQQSEPNSLVSSDDSFSKVVHRGLMLHSIAWLFDKLPPAKRTRASIKLSISAIGSDQMLDLISVDFRDLDTPGSLACAVLVEGEKQHQCASAKQAATHLEQSLTQFDRLFPKSSPSLDNFPILLFSLHLYQYRTVPLDSHHTKSKVVSSHSKLSICHLQLTNSSVPESNAPSASSANVSAESIARQLFPPESSQSNTIGQNLGRLLGFDYSKSLASLSILSNLRLASGIDQSWLLLRQCLLVQSLEQIGAHLVVVNTGEDEEKSSPTINSHNPSTRTSSSEKSYDTAIFRDKTNSSSGCGMSSLGSLTQPSERPTPTTKCQNSQQAQQELATSPPPDSSGGDPCRNIPIFPKAKQFRLSLRSSSRPSPHDGSTVCAPTNATTVSRRPGNRYHNNGNNGSYSSSSRHRRHPTAVRLKSTEYHRSNQSARKSAKSKVRNRDGSPGEVTWTEELWVDGPKAIDVGDQGPKRHLQAKGPRRHSSSSKPLTEPQTGSHAHNKQNRIERWIESTNNPKSATLATSTTTASYSVPSSSSSAISQSSPQPIDSKNYFHLNHLNQLGQLQLDSMRCRPVPTDGVANSTELSKQSGSGNDLNVMMMAAMMSNASSLGLVANSYRHPVPAQAGSRNDEWEDECAATNRSESMVLFTMAEPPKQLKLEQFLQQLSQLSSYPQHKQLHHPNNEQDAICRMSCCDLGEARKPLNSGFGHHTQNQHSGHYARSHAHNPGLQHPSLLYHESLQAASSTTPMLQHSAATIGGVQYQSGASSSPSPAAGCSNRSQQQQTSNNSSAPGGNKLKRNTTSTSTSGHGTISEGECSSATTTNHHNNHHSHHQQQRPLTSLAQTTHTTINPKKGYASVGPIQRQPATSSGYESTIQDDDDNVDDFEPDDDDDDPKFGSTCTATNEHTHSRGGSGKLSPNCGKVGRSRPLVDFTKMRHWTYKLATGGGNGGGRGQESTTLTTTTRGSVVTTHNGNNKKKKNATTTLETPSYSPLSLDLQSNRSSSRCGSLFCCSFQSNDGGRL